MRATKEWNDKLYNTIAAVFDANESRCLDSNEDQVVVIEALLKALDYKTLVDAVVAHDDSELNIVDSDGQPHAVVYTNLSAFELDSMFPPKSPRTDQQPAAE